MFTLVTFCLALAASTPLLAQASPMQQLPRSFDDLPTDTDVLAFDPVSGTVSAYDLDGAFLGHVTSASEEASIAKRADGTCSQLGPNDLKGLSGWSLVEEQAKKNWGKGKYNLATNMANYADYPALACVSDATAKVAVQGKPSCVTTTQTTGGTLVGTSGTATLSALQGTSSSTVITTTKTSNWATGLSVSAKIGIPDIVDTTTTFTSSVSITNSLSHAVTATSNNQQTQSITMNAADGATCSLTFTSKSCTASGKGSIAMIAQGWAWFQYHSKVNGHYYWALNIAKYIPDVAQRSSTIDFTTAISATNDSQYKGTCTKP